MYSTHTGILNRPPPLSTLLDHSCMAFCSTSACSSAASFSEYLAHMFCDQPLTVCVCSVVLILAIEWLVCDFTIFCKNNIGVECMFEHLYLLYLCVSVCDIVCIRDVNTFW